MSADLLVVTVPVLQDNFAYLLHSGGMTAVVDPSEAGPVLRALEERRWTLDLVLNTHHHHDHVGGNLELVERTGCKVAGAARDAGRIPGITLALKGGDRFRVGIFEAEVLETPGHTTGALSYFFPKAHGGQGAVFTGDTLFSLGCGRLFEGTPETMWASLRGLRALPESALLYFGHEYTEKNGAFALTVDPENADLRAYLEFVAERRAGGEPSSPSTIGIERRANPFFRADAPELARAVGLEGAEAVEVFARVRELRNRF